FAEVSLTVDKTPPTVVITSPAAGLTNNRTPQLTYAVSDGTVVVKVGGVVVDKVSGDSLAPLADGTHTVRVEATDTAGNSAFAEVTIGVDTAAPAGGMVINSAAAFTTTPAVTLTLTASDTNGVVEMQFSNDGSSWSSPEPFAITKAWALSSGDGSKSVYVRYRDAAGNWTTAAITAVIVLDTAAPSGAVVINGGSAYTTTTAVTLTLSAADTNEVTQMQFSNNGSAWSSPEPFATTKAWALSSGDGSKSVYGKYKDAAGNWTTANIYGTIVLDTTAPAGSIVINGGSSYTASAAVTLTLSATDASGVTGMQFSNDGSTWTTPEAYATTRNWTLTTADGNKTVYVRYKDANGIWSSPTAISSTIVLDTTAPTITSIDPFNNSTGVPLNKVISSLFTDNVQAGTSYGSIALKKANSAVSITVTVNGSVLNITPISDLSRNTKYTVTIPAGAVMDMAGNALTTASTISFTTTK
ncbi:MAG TPA: Ig-like domain-containing protein, partial [Geobacteraceae bacterium]|nr:Ig-like domain-containing protein [Geobacteraceae bacterium]